VSARDALDAIAARLDAIRGRHEEMWEDIRAMSRIKPVLLNRTQADRQRLLRDSTAMHAALTAVLAEHQPSPGSTEGHGRNGYLGPVCLTCRNADGYPDPWPCDTNLTVDSALQPKGGQS
jgi:hypothetical protein